MTGWMDDWMDDWMDEIRNDWKIESITKRSSKGRKKTSKGVRV